jgi:hypothetical protein
MFILAIIFAINTFVMGLPMGLPINHDDSNNLHCYCSKEHYTSAKIINRSIWYSVNNSKMETFNITKINHSHENINVKGDITLVYSLLNDCYYICKMPILYNDKFKHFILDHLDSYYKVGSYLNMMCNSTICMLGNQQCNIINIKDEL